MVMKYSILHKAREEFVLVKETGQIIKMDKNHLVMRGPDNYLWGSLEMVQCNALSPHNFSIVND